MSLKEKLFEKPKRIDSFILGVFAIFVVFNPYFMHGRINIFEVGLYLPGIQAIFDGQIPFRDFFHLRGPFELYMPAGLMSVFGDHITVLYSYFYIGNILCLIFCVLILRELLKSRLLLYCSVPVLIGRAWPRVTYAYWGGMRYAFGLMAIYFIARFFRTNKSKWMFFAGLASICGLFTSIEIGIYAMAGVFVSFIVSLVLKAQNLTTLIKGVMYYIFGILLVAVPFGIYLDHVQALVPYIQSVWTIVSNMQNVIDPHLVSEYPRNFAEAFVAMVNPVHTNFKHMTPSYCYLALVIFLIYRAANKNFNRRDAFLLCLGVYGFIMYNTGFRGIWAAQFEMALQVEKILYFFLVERVFFYALRVRKETKVKWKSVLCLTYVVLVVLSSFGYAIQRYNHRFISFKYLTKTLTGQDTSKLKPMSNEQTEVLGIGRVKGILVPLDQSQELLGIYNFVNDNVALEDNMLTYPNEGTYNWIFNRPFVGKFPLVTTAWFNDQWHDEFMEELNGARPEYIISIKNLDDNWKAVYLGLEINRKKYDDFQGFLSSNYEYFTETEHSKIYRLEQGRNTDE